MSFAPSSGSVAVSSGQRGVPLSPASNGQVAGGAAGSMGSSQTSGAAVGGSGGFWDTIFDNMADGSTGDDDYGQDALRDKYLTSKDCIILLIDSTAPMFAHTSFADAIRCAASVLTDKVISAEEDLVGVCLYGTNEHNNPNDFPRVWTLMDLDVPDAPRVLELERLAAADPAQPPPHGSMPIEDSVLPVLCDALWTCSSMFSAAVARGARVGTRRIFLFTNDSAAIPGGVDSPGAKDRCLQRARDLADLGVAIVLFAMSPEGQERHRFGPESFFAQLLGANGDVRAAEEGVDCAQRFDELREHVRCREFRKRTLARLPLTIGNTGISLSVKLYVLQRRSEKGRSAVLDVHTNQPLRTTLQWVNDETGGVIPAANVKPAFTYGAERVVLEKEDVLAVKAIATSASAPATSGAGFKLLGFKARSALRVQHNIRHSSFLYPDERSIRGSTTAFTALLSQMLALDKIAIAAFAPRINASPRLVALLPQAEEYDGLGAMTVPPGFHVIPLPYADDIRKITLPKSSSDADAPAAAAASAVQIDLAKKIVRRLRIDFSSRNFDNPALQRHFAALQALALDRSAMEPVRDLLVPDEEGMARFSGIVADFSREVFPPGYVSKTGNTPAKRTRPAGIDGGSEAPAAKRTARPADEIDWDRAVAEGSISKATVGQLQEFLRLRGVKFASKDRKEQLLALAIESVKHGGPVHAATVDDDDDDDDDNDGDAAALAAIAAVAAEEDDAEQLAAAQAHDDDKAPAPAPTLPACQYGMQCYRKNPQHFLEFSHPPGHPGPQ